ncbi:hypothetical protein [Pelagicoccus albus]|uniref:Uncharacterized protein n=1 Tax=Pelagicoccus albus TaxID=415222 RepID=A0A7X1B870_9BACT|nr:hypothetical protein [Pelagicoccus albus]MBC2607450.1 hypothetical protein [Pelagicoccus albus]
MKKSLYRIAINWYQASDKPLPAWLERACQKDDSLAAEKRFGDDLTRSLKRSPNDREPITGDDMASRVLRQITEEDYLAEQQQSDSSAGFAGWARGVGMAAAAFTIALGAYQFLDTDNGLPNGGESGAIVMIESEKATDGLLEDVTEDWKNPLDQEVEYIVSDAKNALSFLATTFVPSSYLVSDENAS